MWWDGSGGGLWHFTKQEFNSKEHAEELEIQKCCLTQDWFWSLVPIYTSVMKIWDGADDRSSETGSGYPSEVWIHPKASKDSLIHMTKELSSLSQWAVGAYIYHSLETRRSTKSWFPSTSYITCRSVSFLLNRYTKINCHRKKLLFRASVEPIGNPQLFRALQPYAEGLLMWRSFSGLKLKTCDSYKVTLESCARRFSFLYSSSGNSVWWVSANWFSLII